MTVASRFAIFSLSSEGLMTTAFPAEHAESGPCPPSDHAGSPSVLCVLGGTDRRAEGRRPQKLHHPPSVVVQMREKGEEKGGKGLGPDGRAELVPTGGTGEPRCI